METTIMENQMEKTMENEMETREYIGIMGNIGVIWGLYRDYRVYIGPILGQ